jgi:hypothetical protein
LEQKDYISVSLLADLLSASYLVVVEAPYLEDVEPLASQVEGVDVEPFQQNVGVVEEVEPY